MSLRFIFTYHHQVMLSRTEKPGGWKSHPVYKFPGGRPLVIKTSVIAAKDAFTSRGQSQSCLWVGSYRFDGPKTPEVSKGQTIPDLGPLPLSAIAQGIHETEHSPAVRGGKGSRFSRDIQEGDLHATASAPSGAEVSPAFRRVLGTRKFPSEASRPLVVFPVSHRPGPKEAPRTDVLHGEYSHISPLETYVSKGVGLSSLMGEENTLGALRRYQYV
jgi:hypothetical protein